MRADGSHGARRRWPQRHDVADRRRGTGRCVGRVPPRTPRRARDDLRRVASAREAVRRRRDRARPGARRGRHRGHVVAGVGHPPGAIPRHGDAVGGRPSCGSTADDPLSDPRDAALVVASRAAFDAALLAAACRAGADARRRARHRRRLEPGGARIHDRGRLVSRALPDRRRRRQQPRQAPARAPVPARRPLDRDRLLRARRHERRDRHRADGRSARIHLVVSPADHLAIGICAQADAGSTVAALRDRAAAWIRETRIADGARLEPYSWPIPSLGVERLRDARAGWTELVRGRRRRRARRSDYARRHLLRAAVRRMGRRRGARRRRVTVRLRACARKSSPSWRAPRGSRPGSFVSGPRAC